MSSQLTQAYVSCFFPSIFLSALCLVWLPLSALYTHLLLLNSFSSSPMTQSEGSSSPPRENSIFPYPALRTCVPIKENLCKRKLDREVYLGEGQEGRKTKYGDIILQFLQAPELLPTFSTFCRTLLCTARSSSTFHRVPLPSFLFQRVARNGSTACFSC